MPSIALKAVCICGVRHVRHFREMVRKRALVASRDVKGAFFTLLLPVLAVAAVLVRETCPSPRSTLSY